ncbi:MAG: quinoprotein dehydrogenase-associated SoxYZ-like carrier [Alphaproteobacteria bacterium]
MRSEARMLRGAGVLGLALFLATAVAVSPALAEAEVEDSWANIKAALFGDKVIADGAGIIELDTPYRAADAAIVPITVTALRPQGQDDYIKTITIVIDENPSPVAARIHMTPESGLATVSTRIRIDAYTHVRAIAETSDGELYMAASFVKAAGGCSAPSLKDAAAAMARLGQMKMRFVEAGVGDEPGYAQLLISHPNYTGLQFNQITRSEIPAHYVESIEVSRGDATIFTLEGDISLSEDPSIHFYYKGEEGAELKAVITDSEGQVFEKSWPVPPAAES